MVTNEYEAYMNDDEKENPMFSEEEIVRVASSITNPQMKRPGIKPGPPP
jgi:hypothetical protein